MADFEDATSPTWENVLDGQLNVRDAARRTISFTNPDGRSYALAAKTATLLMRPRGWHLPEKHVLLDGEPVSGTLFDWGLYFFHNARQLVADGSGPYFYLPKMESHLEARLWNDVFVHAQTALGLPIGTIRATVLIETILAAFEAEEILYEIRDHASGLNCGRWDYIFSCIKKLSSSGRADLSRPRSGDDDGAVHARLRAPRDPHLPQARRLRDGRHGGADPDQERSRGQRAGARQGASRQGARSQRRARRHLGGAPRPGGDRARGLQRTAPGQAQPGRSPAPGDRHSGSELREQLLSVPAGAITEVGVRSNLEVGVRYVEAWLSGLGCVPIHHLMEDAATSEISRCQLWQWLHHGGKLDDGRALTVELYEKWMAEEMAELRAAMGEERWKASHFEAAIRLYLGMVKSGKLEEFLTLPAYELLP